MRPDLYALANGRWPSILMALRIPEKFLQNKHGPCPFDGGRDRFRFDDKEGTGTFYCSKCGAGTGVEFVMRFHGVDFREAKKMILKEIPGSTRQTPKKSINSADTKRFLKAVWEESKTASAADDTGLYLAGRHLVIPKACKALRTHPGLEWRDAEGKVQGKYPCMIAAVRDNQGNPIALHRTWLYDGKQAPVEQPKKSFGKLNPECAIQLFPLKSALAVSEGIETAIAVNALFGYACWSLISASQMERWRWPKSVTSLLIAGDMDASFTGHKAAYTLAYRAKAEGLNVIVRIPELQNTDWADELKLQKSKANVGAY